MVEINPNSEAGYSHVVAQVSKSAVSPTSKSAGPRTTRRTKSPSGRRFGNPRYSRLGGLNYVGLPGSDFGVRVYTDSFGGPDGGGTKKTGLSPGLVNSNCRAEYSVRTR